MDFRECKAALGSAVDSQPTYNLKNSGSLLAGMAQEGFLRNDCAGDGSFTVPMNGDTLSERDNPGRVTSP